LRITGTYTTPTWNKKKYNFRPHFPVDSGFQIFPQEALKDFSSGKNQKNSCTARILSPPRYTGLFRFPGVKLQES